MNAKQVQTEIIKCNIQISKQFIEKGQINPENLQKLIDSLIMLRGIKRSVAFKDLLEQLVVNLKNCQLYGVSHLQNDQNRRVLSQIYLCYALIQEWKQQTFEASQNYEKAKTRDQENPLLLLCFSEYLFKQNKKEWPILLQKIKKYNPISQRYRKNIDRFFKQRFSFQNWSEISKSMNKPGGTVIIFDSALLYQAGQFYKSLIKQKKDVQQYLVMNSVVVFMNQGKQKAQNQIKKIMDYEKSIQDSFLVGKLFTCLYMYKQSLSYLERARKIGSLFYKDASIKMVESLIRLKLFDRAKYIALDSLNYLKDDPLLHQYIADIYQNQGQSPRAIQHLQYLLQNYKQKNILKEKQIYNKLISNYVHVNDNRKAFKCLKASMKASLSKQSLYQQASAFKNSSNYLLKAFILEQAIKFDYYSYCAFVQLSQLSQKSENIKQQINRFMEKFRLRHQQNEHIQFNVELFYFLSQQQTDKFHKFIIKIFKKQFQQDILQYLSQEQKEYQKLVQNQAIVFRMIVGVISMEMGNILLSQRLFQRLLKDKFCNKNQNNYENSADQCQNIHYENFADKCQNILSKTGKLKPIFVEWILRQLLKKSQFQGISCYNRVKNTILHDYKYFKLDVIKQFKQTISRIENQYYTFYKNYWQPVQKGIQNKSKHINDRQKFTLLKKTQKLFDQCKSILRTQVDINIPKDYEKLWSQMKDEDQKLEGLISSQLLILKQISIERIAQINIFVYLKPTVQKTELLINNHIIKSSFKLLYYESLLGTKNKQIMHQLEEFKRKDITFDTFKDRLEKHVITKFQYIQGNEQDLNAAQSQISFNFFDQSSIRILNDNISQVELQHPQSALNYKPTNKRKLSLQVKPLHFELSNEVAQKRQSRQNKDIPATKDKQKLISEHSQKLKSQQKRQSIMRQEKQLDESSLVIKIQDQDPILTKIIQLQQIQKEEIHSHIRKLEDSICSYFHQKLYRYLKKILFKLFFDNIVYISIMRPKFIPLHWVDIDDYIRRTGQQNQKFDSFTLKVEKGVELSCDQNKSLQILWEDGRSIIFKWIIDVARAINELQELGIYHADLGFRNTIKIIKKGKLISFKVIDFNKAFVYKNTKYSKQAYERTLQSFEYWIKFKFQEQRAPKEQIWAQSESSKQQMKTICHITDFIDFVFEHSMKSVIQELLQIKNKLFYQKGPVECVQVLQRFAKNGHLHQFTNLVNTLIGAGIHNNPVNKKQIKQKQLQQILHNLNLLNSQGMQNNQNSFTYLDFANKIQELLKVNYRDN